MPIELYTWNTPNGRKISVALEEMGLPYNVHPVNISQERAVRAGLPEDQPEQPDSRDHRSGRAGRRSRSACSKSGAILIYLGQKTGKFYPADLRRQVPVLEWLMWQMGGFGPMPGQVHHFLMVENPQDQRYGLERYSKETAPAVWRAGSSGWPGMSTWPTRSRLPISPFSAGRGGMSGTGSIWPTTPT